MRVYARVRVYEARRQREMTVEALESSDDGARSSWMDHDGRWSTMEHDEPR